MRLNETVRGLQFVPQYVALEKGYFADEGLKIDFRTAWGDDKSMTALLTKRDDIALMGTEVGFYSSEQGIPDPALYFAQLIQRDVTFLIKRPGGATFSWQGLKGKTILSPRPQSPPHMVLLWVLNKHGLTPGKDVTVIALRPQVLFPAFLKGRGDFLAVWEPFVTLAGLQRKGELAVSIGVEGGAMGYGAYAAQSSYIKANADTVQKFTNALYKGMQWTDAHSSQEIAKLIHSAYFQRAREGIVAKGLERYRKQQTWRSDPRISDEHFKTMQKILIFSKALKQPQPLSKIVVHGFGEKAVQAAKLKK